MQTQHVDTIASTSLALRERIERGTLDGPAVLVAGEQTGGVGQFGRRWFSPPGGLWFSVALPSPRAAGSRALSDDIAGDATRLPLGSRLGHVCLDTLARFIGAHVPASVCGVRLKEPNDLLLVSARHPQGAKVAGILTEIVRSADPACAWILVGIGINSNVPSVSLPTGLPYPATSLLAELGMPVSNDALLSAMLRAIRLATD